MEPDRRSGESALSHSGCEGKEGRIDRRFSRDIRNFAFATMGMILATTTPMWVTLLRDVGDYIRG